MLKVNFAGGVLPSQRFKVSLNTTLQDLISFISLVPAMNIADGRIQILAGYPPALVHGRSDAALMELSIKAGDSITVREGVPETLLPQEAISDLPVATTIFSQVPSGSTEVESAAGAEDMIEMLISMGFSRRVCEQAISIVGSSMDSFDLAVETCAAINMSLDERVLAPAPAPAAPPAPAPAPPTMKRLAIDADNSCLFRAIGFAIEFDARSFADPNRVQTDKYRQMIAAFVLAGAEDVFCSEAVLGMTQAAYAAWILKPEKWGGELELSILARTLSLCIKVFDIRTQIVHSYAPEASAPQRALFLIYDGIHYDCLVRGPALGLAVTQMIFALDDADANSQCMRISAEALAAREFTNIDDKSGKFELVCLVCQQGLRHADDARAHASQTGHQNFGQM